MRLSDQQTRLEETLASLSDFELEVGHLIVETLNLPLKATEINPLAPLFGEGLGLDSIDALELSLALHQTYGCRLKSGDPGNVEIFASLRSLADFVQSNRSS
jgi:acyl carrier protein